MSSTRIGTTADLKAARMHIDERLTKFAFDSDEAVVTGVKLGALRTLLTALDQAAEALKPFKDALPIIESGISLSIADDSGSIIVDDADFQRSATVYATLKPETDNV